MATVIKALHDDFLSCIICTDLYKEPCTLVCGHTFCRGCLAKYTKTQQDAIKAKSIPCPNCRQMTKVTNPGGPLEDWVKQIKPSFLIQGLLDRFASQSIDDIAPENSCFSCLHHDMKTPGTSHCMDCDVILCDKCVKTHRTLPGTSNHVIVDLGGKVKVRRKRKVMCKSHNCVVEFCCKDCQKAVCQKCYILHHRKCDNVVMIESMVPEMTSVLGGNKDILTKQLKETKSALAEKERKISEIGVKKGKLHSEIRKVSQKAINLIKQKEKQLTDELDGITERQIEELKAQMKKGEIDMQMYQQHCEFIEQTLTVECEMDTYEMYQMCKSGAVTSLAQTEKEHEYMSGQGEITFEEEFDQQKMKSHLHLSNIRILKAEFDPNCTPTLVDTIDIKIESDEEIPDPVDVTVVNVDGTETLVVTDYSNACIKSFYTMEQQARHNSIKLNSNPRSVTRLCHNQVAVFFHSHNQIALVEVTPGLVLLSNITTQKKYRGLTALNDSTLVGGCLSPPSLDILDMTGRILRSITPGRIKIQRPSFLHTTNNGNILVSDNLAKSVYCLTPKGDVVFNYSPSGAIVYPRGITTSSTGDILVADNYNSRLMQLTSTGHFVRDILTSQDGIDKPYSICLHKHTLYVAKDDGPVKVFCVATKQR